MIIISVSELDKTPSLGKDIQGALLISLPRLLEQLHMMPNLKAAANHGVGYNHIDIKGNVLFTMAQDINFITKWQTKDVGHFLQAYNMSAISIEPYFHPKNGP